MSRASPNQDAAIWPATAFAAALIAQQVAAKATRDALFLSTIGVAGLPAMLIAAGVASLLLVPVSSRIMSALGPARLVPAAFVISGLLLGVEWLLASWLPRVVAVLFYLQVATLNAILISWFWSMMSERFNPRAARQKMQRLVAGAAFGGLVGGLLAERMAVYLGVARMPAVLGLLHLVCAALAWRLRPVDVAARPSASHPPAATEGSPIDAAPPTRATGWGFQVLMRSRYIRDLATLVLFGTLTGTLLDYVFKLEAAAMYGRGPGLLRFFAVFYAVVGLLTFVVQTGLSRAFLTHLGLARTVATLPGAVAISSVGALLAPGLASVALARGAEATLRNSLYRSGYEIFYTPIRPDEKRAVKTIIDVGCERLGDVLGGGMIQLVLLLAPSGPRIGLLGVAVLLALGLLLLTARLQPGYVRSLERSLLDRAVDLDVADIRDSTTLSVASAIGLPTLSKLAAAKGSAAARQTPVPSPAPTQMRLPTAVADPAVERIAALRSGDARQARTALQQAPITRDLAAPAIALLGWDELAPSALQALRAVAGSIVGQLSDALLSPDEEFTVRRRVARVLAASDDPRAVDALLLGLKDARFEVRYRCGRALAAIRDRNPNLGIDGDQVFATVLREVNVGKGVWESQRLLDQFGESDDSPFVDEFLRDRASRSLEHVFTLLSLVLARQPLSVAFHGLYTNDEALRGTALEYLEGVLPPEIREPLWPFLEDRRPRQRLERPREDVLAELLLSNKSIQLNLDQLRRAAQPRTP